MGLAYEENGQDYGKARVDEGGREDVGFVCHCLGGE